MISILIRYTLLDAGNIIYQGGLPEKARGSEVEPGKGPEVGRSSKEEGTG